MFIAATIGILVAMGLAMTRAILGPTVFDRVLAVNTFGTKTVLLIAALGFLTERPEFLDLALVYALELGAVTASVGGDGVQLPGWALVEALD